MLRRTLLIAGLFLSLTAHASPIRTSSFDIADQSTSSSSNCTQMDSLEHTDVLTGGAIDGDACLQSTIVHDANNGGDSASSSKLAARFQATSSGRSAAYKWKNDLPAATTYIFHRTFYVSSAPGSGLRRAIWCAAENNSDTDFGCCVAVNDDRSLTLFYQGDESGASCSSETCGSDAFCFNGRCRAKWGTTGANTITASSCASDRRLACTSSANCPSSSSCNEELFLELELGQTNQGSLVICELYNAGLPVFTGVALDPPGSPIGNITNEQWGLPAVGETTATATVYADDAVVDNSGIRAGHGYVFRKVISAESTTVGLDRWAATSSGPPAKATEIDDYNVGSFAYDSGVNTNNSLRSANEQRKQWLLNATPAVVLGAGETVGAVEVVAAGATSTGGGTRELAVGVLTCHADPSTCADDTDCCYEPQMSSVASISTNTSPDVLNRYLVETPPINAWGQYVGSGFAQGVVLDSGNTGQNLYVGAVALMGFVKKLDRGELTTIRDRNKGTEDGLRVGCAIGDSTDGATLATTCQGGANDGQICSQPDYCSNIDAQNRDQPFGGCHGDDTVCDTCTGNRNINCAVGGDCDLRPCTGGTCSDGQTLCPNGDTDCNYGSCDTSGVCTPSCPGGDCPDDRPGWSASLLPLGYDVFIKWPKGGEDAGQFYHDRWPDVQDGKGTATSNGFALGGAPGVCSVGGAACASVNDCASGYCQFPKCDDIYFLEPYNGIFAHGLAEIGGPINHGEQTTYLRPHDPECETVFSLQGNGVVYDQPVEYCPQYGASGYARSVTPCDSQNECDGISTTSSCLGRCINTAKGCSYDGDPNCSGGGCTIDAPSCSKSDECRIATGASVARTCSVDTSAFRGALPIGLCQCTADNQCPTGFWCVVEGSAGLCRRKCDTNGNADCDSGPGDAVCDAAACGSGRVTCSNSGNDYCQGRCNVPCNAISATTDDDCGSTTLWDSSATARGGQLRTPLVIKGKRNPSSGNCACCGLVGCTEHEALLRGGCSCDDNSDCNGGGTCDPNRKVCVGTGSRSNCKLDSECDPAERCMRCQEQADALERVVAGLPIEVAERMQADINAYPESDQRPALFVIEVPLPGGILTDGSMSNDAACVAAHGSRAYYVDLNNRLAASTVIPSLHKISMAAYNVARHALGLLTDHVHPNILGGAYWASLIRAHREKLNTCVKDSDGSPQKYCKNANDTFDDDNGTSTCTTNADCDTDETCSRRPCVNSDGTTNDSNCPSSSPADHCQGD